MNLRKITLAKPDQGGLYTITAGETLVQFLAYDLSLFEEKCMELTYKSRTSGELDDRQVNVLNHMFIQCHPFCEAMFARMFSQIVLDCMIEFICDSEGAGLEELWARYISPQNSFEKRIFLRITDYKTGQAINQWVNLCRMQEYARKKVSFLFDTEPVSADEYEMRARYFDMLFHLRANDLGYFSEDLPEIKRYNPSQIPHAPFVFHKMASSAMGMLRDAPAVNTAKRPRQNSFMQDQACGEVLGYLEHIERPAHREARQLMEYYRDIPEEIFVTGSLKAVLDLELDRVLSLGLHFEKDNETGVYHTVLSDQALLEVPQEPKQQVRIQPEPEVLPEPEPDSEALKEPETGQEQGAEASAEAEEASERQAVNNRCQSIYTALYMKIGKGLTEQEFEEWSRYLMRLRRNVLKKTATTEELNSFLNDTVQIYAKLLNNEFLSTY